MTRTVPFPFISKVRFFCKQIRNLVEHLGPWWRQEWKGRIEGGMEGADLNELPFFFIPSLSKRWWRWHNTITRVQISAWDRGLLWWRIGVLCLRDKHSLRVSNCDVWRLSLHTDALCKAISYLLFFPALSPPVVEKHESCGFFFLSVFLFLFRLRCFQFTEWQTKTKPSEIFAGDWTKRDHLHFCSLNFPHEVSPVFSKLMNELVCREFISEALDSMWSLVPFCLDIFC